LVILVGDLDTAVEDYRALGFTVTPGGTHTDGATHNALVAFADGVYLELIAFLREAPEHRWWRHTAAGEGLVDFALLPDDTGQVIAQASRRGLNMTGPTDGGRQRPDGQQLRWQTGLPPSANLPFLCGDVTPRALRVPEGEAREHANGVVGIAGVTVAVEDIAVAREEYAALLGVAAPPIANLVPLPLRVAVFTLENATITLVQPTMEAGVFHTRLMTRGAGPVGFATTVEGIPPADWPDPALAHGVFIAPAYAF
jgi:hypothetical protein